MKNERKDDYDFKPNLLGFEFHNITCTGWPDSVTIENGKKSPEWKTREYYPLIHAHWIIEKKHYPKHLVRIHICSNCKCASKKNYKFCPNCGAKMDEEEER